MAKASRSRSRWSRSLLASLLSASTLALPSVCSAAPLVAQMAVCLPDGAQDPNPLGIDKVTGYANDPTRMTKFYIKYVYSVDDTSFPPGMKEPERTHEIAKAIVETTRVEVCWINPAGEISCPAQGGEGLPQWLIFDDKTKPLAKPILPGDVRRSLGEVVKSDARISDEDKSSKLRIFSEIPFNWDSPDNEGKILFLVVNGKTPQSLADIQQELSLGGYCPTPTRIAKAGDMLPKAPTPPPGQPEVDPFYTATDSAPGTTTTEDIHFVAYGIPHDFPLPPGWNLGDICAPSKGNKTSYLDYNPCIHRGTTLFGLDLLVGVDMWQRGNFQSIFATDPGKKIATWPNGTGYPGSLCTQGKTCPTRVQWLNYVGGAGYSFGGKHVTDPAPLKSPAEPMSYSMGNHLRNNNHEYFHGLQGAHATVAGKVDLFI